MYYNESTLVFLDGNWVKASEISVSLYSQTLHYGIGVFEGIRSYKTEDGNKIFKAKEQNGNRFTVFSRGINRHFL